MTKLINAGMSETLEWKSIWNIIVNFIAEKRMQQNLNKSDVTHIFKINFGTR